MKRKTKSTLTAQETISWMSDIEDSIEKLAKSITLLAEAHKELESTVKEKKLEEKLPSKLSIYS